MVMPAMRSTGPFTEYLRGNLLESGANTFTELEIATPVGRSEDIVMLIHGVTMFVGDPDIEDAQTNLVQIHLHNATRLAISTPDVAGNIYFHDEANSVGVIQGTLSEFQHYFSRGDPYFRMYQPPRLYAKASIFMGIVGTGNANPKRMQMRLEYTLARVSKEEFIAALVD